MAQLEGKVIAITGAASGIGAATARIAAERGASLVLGDVDQAALSTFTDELKSTGAKVISCQLDVTKQESVESWIDQAIEKFGKLDGAANCAGVGSVPGGEFMFSIPETSNEHWDWLLKVNLTGVFFCLRAQLRAMGSGASIVNVSSISGLNGYSGVASYVSSKHGVSGLTKTAAKEAGPRGIRVNAVAPGRTDTPLLRSHMNDSAKVTANGAVMGAENIPLRRFALPEEIAKTILFALSDDASYTTGTTFTVDGGRIA